jgi:hypothetical protein
LRVYTFFSFFKLFCKNPCKMRAVVVYCLYDAGQIFSKAYMCGGERRYGFRVALALSALATGKIRLLAFGGAL